MLVLLILRNGNESLMFVDADMADNVKDCLDICNDNAPLKGCASIRCPSEPMLISRNTAKTHVVFDRGSLALLDL